MMNSNLEQMQMKQRIRTRIVSSMTVVCMMTALCVTVAFAGDTPSGSTTTAAGFSALESAGKGVLKGLWDFLQAITAPLALIGIGANVIKALLGTDKGMEKCKDNIIKILFVVGVIFLAPLLVTTVTGAIGNLADSSTNQIFS